MSFNSSLAIAVLLGALILSSGGALAGLDPSPPHLVSVRFDGVPAQSVCTEVRYAGDGRSLIFTCRGNELVPGNLNNLPDVFVWSRDKGTTELVSVTTGGAQVSYASTGGIPSHDGTSVVLRSRGPLHPDWIPPPQPDDAGGRDAAYLRDRTLGTTDLIARDAIGSALPTNVVSTDANFELGLVLIQSRFDLFAGLPTASAQAWIRNWRTGEIDLVSRSLDGSFGVGDSGQAVLSPIGRLVAFSSLSRTLDPETLPGSGFNLFIRDRQVGSTQRLTWRWDGNEFESPLGARVSRVFGFTADGRRVVFSSASDELIEGDDSTVLRVFTVDVDSGALQLLTRAANGGSPDARTSSAALSADGRYLAFHSIASNMMETGVSSASAVYVDDLLTGERVVLTDVLGPPPDPGFASEVDITPDGTAVAFTWRVNHLPGSTPGQNRDLVYEVRLRGVVPPAPPVAVPATGRLSAGLLALSLLLAGVVMQRRRVFR